MNHPYPPRGMVPQGAPSQRLNELLESIRGEFETESQRSVDYESQSESPPMTIHVGCRAPFPARASWVQMKASHPRTLDAAQDIHRDMSGYPLHSAPSELNVLR